jgi:hypothetical protein
MRASLFLMIVLLAVIGWPIAVDIATVHCAAVLEPPRGEIVLEVDYQPTADRDLGALAALRVPAFRLYEDGLIIYSEQSSAWSKTVMVAELTPRERSDVIAGFFSLGFEQLQFIDSPHSPRDSAEIVLRAQSASGLTTEIRGHKRSVNLPEVLDAILAYVDGFSHPDATPYEANRGVIVRPRHVTEGSGDGYPRWPLAIGECFEKRVVVLGAQQMRDLTEAVDGNAGFYKFNLDGRAYSFELIPWLPGEDYTELLRHDLGASMCEMGEGG